MTRTRLVRPLLPDMEAVARYLEPSFAQGQLSNWGPANELFTERLRERYGVVCDLEVITTSSGHTALMAAYAALGVRRLVVPAFTFASTASAAILQGISVLYADVDPATGCLSVETLYKINPDSYDAVVYVCALSTFPENVYAVADYCDAHEKVLILDAAATFGTQGLLHIGDAVCVSFHATKTLSIGEGGALVLPSCLVDRARAFLNFGRDSMRRVAFADGVPIAGINGKLSEYGAAVGLALLHKVDAEIAARRVNAERYKDLLGKRIRGWRPGTVYAFMPTFVSPDAPVGASGRIKQALAALEIDAASYYDPLAPMPTALDLYSRSVCLPVHSGVDEALVVTIAKVYIEKEQAP